ncbi:Abi family protein [Tuanshanicoccus lijuaniae]|uniref:Abi family protein n=1 Tax=Aerococcaceae bacterium zg-1292 TaxID=2774330 RepID=UPI001BD838E1|nr:Abi family protein [Aerococcaceae bacterium zg-BR22]MBS4455245.1 Abi family protein [Aerococcaceae bacterium zg-A91]MBS4457945.1 Abi family protein [Aerococcaceae bacterium zg-BR33]
MTQYLNYTEQIKKIESYGVKIDNEIELRLHLKSFGYYSYINAYKNKIKSKPKGYFSTSDLFYIYMFDFEIQTILFKYILFIEQQLKEFLNEIICSKGNELEFNYLNPKNYRGENTGSKLTSIIAKIRTNHDPIKYYISKKTNTPPWVFFKHIDFGDTQLFYKMQVKEDKEYIVDNFYNFLPHNTIEIKKDLFSNSLEYIRNYRNVIAHGNSLFLKQFNSNVNYAHFVNLFGVNVVTKQEYDVNLLGNGDAFGLLFHVLSLQCNPILQRMFIKDLEELWRKSNYQSIKEKIIYVSNFKEDFIDILYLVHESIQKEV